MLTTIKLDSQLLEIKLSTE